MAYVAQLLAPDVDLTEFVNLDGKVGGDSDCPNHRSDVQAVQSLIALVLRGTPGWKLGAPWPSGQFDAITGYHVFNIQNFLKRSRPGTVVDGCVSPAHGISYGGGTWCILNLNLWARNKDHAAWQKILGRYRASAPAVKIP